MNNIPDPIRRYFELAIQPDPEAFLALFAQEATVEDEDKQHTGIDAIRAWHHDIPPVTYALHDVIKADEATANYAASADIVGSFAPEPIRLTFRFELDDTRRIRRLTIQP